ncbi:MAG: GxxExxY protein [Candidatus Magasanikbacteria bacterium]|jgi:GxxExxY protein|nr:GxxExxY protein [Candidatus Magasanikbacteria bacterium]
MTRMRHPNDTNVIGDPNDTNRHPNDTNVIGDPNDTNRHPNDTNVIGDPNDTNVRCDLSNSNKSMSKILHKDLSYFITGLCFKTQNALGRFCREIQYANKFEELLKESKINYKREYQLAVGPDGNRVDFLIEDKIIIDFKAKKFITKEDYNQMQRYLQSANLELGMIINFRNTYLKPKRILNSKYSELNNGDPNDPNLHPNNPNIGGDSNVSNSGNSDVIRVIRIADNSDRSGFTLIETILYITIISAVMGAFVSFSLSVANSSNKTYAVQEVQANSRVSLEIITQKIQSATGVNIASSTFGSDPGVLSLSFASSTLNPTIIQLSDDDGILQITEGGADPINITSSEVQITNLQFTNLTGTGNRENIKIDTTIEFFNAESVEFQHSQSLQTTVSLRQ